MSWKLLQSSIVSTDPFEIEERTYELPDGQEKNFYVRRTRPAVCLLALTEGRKVIVVEQFRPGPDKVLDELPGGFMEEGEEPEQAAARELFEETGYAGRLQFVTECIDDAYSTMNRFCFIATGCKRVGDQQLDETEFINVKLIDLDEFLKTVRSGQMTDVEVAFLGLDKLGIDWTSATLIDDE